MKQKGMVGMGENEKHKKRFLIRLDVQWWIEGYSNVDAIQHLVNVIYRDKFLNEHHPAFRCIGEKAIEGKKEEKK